MKKGKYLFSILVLVLSVIACSFVFAQNKTQSEVYAANNVDCYYLLGQDGKPYKANVPIGSLDGTGEYAVGTENAPIKAAANENYQIVGWQVVYVEQSHKSEFFDLSGLADNKKEISLTDKEGVAITAIVEFSYSEGFATESTFTLSYIFEDLVVRPVFDHIYYFIDVTNIAEIAIIPNYKQIDENVLWYQEETVEDATTKYSDAVVMMDDKFFFYGDLYFKDNKYFTKHKTLNDAQTVEEIEYTLGGFRVGDEVSSSFNVNIDATDVKASKNIDLLGVTLLGKQSVELAKVTDALTANSFKSYQDVYSRTNAVDLKITVVANSKPTNTLELYYHELYVADINVLVDGIPAESELEDIFGSVENKRNEILSNISIYNFYAKTNDNNLQFLFKNANNNASKPFGVTCADSISKVVDGVSYKYYDFASIDGAYAKSAYYSNVNQNITVEISYSSTKYEVEVYCAEYKEDAEGNVVLGYMDGAEVSPILLKRGQTVSLDATFVQAIQNIGYNFKGFALGLTGEVLNEISHTINKDKPQNATVFLCYEKIEYNIVFTNYNIVKIDELSALSSVSFAVNDGVDTFNQTLYTADLTGESVTLSVVARIGETITISDVVNSGFYVWGYSVKVPSEVTAEDYTKTFTIDETLIIDNSIDDEIVIYVYEDLIKYSITYYIEHALDSTLGEQVLMAQIDATSAGATIEKYDASNNLISHANANLDAVVAKVVISNLKLNDSVVLTSVGFTAGEGEDAYTYVFNWFTEDDKSTLSYTQIGDTYSHTEVVRKNRNIKVVYSMPSTKVFITVDEELATNEHFSFEYEVLGDTVVQDINNANLFNMAVGTEITVKVTEVAFGYNFVGCEYVELNENIAISNQQFNYTTKVGINTLKLDFDQVKYYFIFSQYGAGLDGDKVEFDGKQYAELDIDNSKVIITKPLGYYVANVNFNNKSTQYSSLLSETNNYRRVEDITKYDFAMQREDFVDVVTNYGTANALGVVEVNVQLEYAIFTYQITVGYSITNPKGNEYDNYVTFPEVALEYVFEGETYTLTSSYYELNKVKFDSIPYGSDAEIKLVGATPVGFSLFGWSHASGAGVLQAEYPHSLESLRINSLTRDKDFIYSISYNAYVINIVSTSGQGSPAVYINDVIKTNDRKITLFDSLNINANASRENGYTYDEISYKKPVYSQYNYVESNWAEQQSSLYVKNGEVYVLNNSDVYDASKTYYVYSEKVETVKESSFADEMFKVENYALEADGKTIIFNVKYKLLDLSIVNKVSETSANSRQGWSLIKGRGPDSKNPLIKFNVSELASFKITAVNEIGEERSIQDETFVNFYDTITVNVSINKEAVNIDGKKYDLTLGLILKTVKIGGKAHTFTNTGEMGEYTFNFAIREYMPEVGEEIEIAYTLYIETQTVNVTTIVTNSDTFYNNVQLTIDAQVYKFSGIFYTNDKAPSVSQGLQFLAKTDVKADLLTESYKDNFVVSGAYIYCDGQLISEEEDAIYGIERNYAQNEKGIRYLTKITSLLMRDLDVKFIVQPQITYNNGPEFRKTFICDENGIGIEQQLKVGSTNDCDIQVDSMLQDAISLSYKLAVDGAYETQGATNVGRYNVKLTFTNVNEFDWLNEITVAENVALIIEPKEIYLDYDRKALTTVEKVYDATSAYSVQNVQKYLMYTDGKTNGFSMSYSNALRDRNLLLINAESYIAYAYPDGRYAEISTANENVYYDVYLFNFTLQDTSFNKNFVLKNNDLKIQQFIKIIKKQIILQNVSIYSKVYDGTDKAEFSGIENITISHTIKGDDVSINLERLNPRFENSNVGTNKRVRLDAGAALVGKDINNYYIEEVQIEGLTIYPYSLSVNIPGLGTVEVENRRGLTEKDKVALIPLNATLDVTPIYEGDNTYVRIYHLINKSLKGNNEFAVGYEINFLINGQKESINNNLYLSIPMVKNLTGVYFLTGQQSGAVVYNFENGKMVIDLSQVNGDVSQIYATKTKLLLKPWQIVLIVVGAVLLIAGVVLVFIIIRRRKVDRDSVHEKI